MSIIKSNSQEDKQGSTTAKGSFTISETNGDIKINLDFSVKKTGISGTGYGAMAFILTGEGGQELYRWTKGFSVGAELDGEHTKKDSAEISFLKWDQVVAYEFKVQATGDTIGIPTSIEGWIEEIGDNLIPIIGGLGVMEDKVMGSWIIGKLK